MVFLPERAAIVGATGPTGYHLARELVSRGRGVRVVSRRRGHLEQVSAGQPVVIATADALAPKHSPARVEDCDLVVDAIGFPPERMADHPVTARNVASASGGAETRCLLVSSYWSFLPHRGEAEPAAPALPPAWAQIGVGQLSGGKGEAESVTRC